MMQRGSALAQESPKRTGNPVLGAQIKAARDARGLTLEQVARRMDPPSTQGTLSNIERGNRGVRPKMLRQLAAVLGGSYDEWARLMGWGTRPMGDSGFNPTDDELPLWQEFGSWPTDVKRFFLDMARPVVERFIVRSKLDDDLGEDEGDGDGDGDAEGEAGDQHPE